MKRFKENKFTLLLFISTIVIIGLFITNVVINVIDLDTIVNKLDEDSGGYFSATGMHALYVMVIVVLVIEGIFVLIVAICGFRCSLTGDWKLGAIIIGALYTFEDFLTLFDDFFTISFVLNLISLAASVGYLIGAIKSTVKYIHIDKTNSDFFKNDDKYDLKDEFKNY